MTSEAIALWTETSSDPELIAGVRAGDSAAFGVLYERHVDAARKVAAQYTNTFTDIDDVVSESFSRVLRALQRGDGPDLAFRAYLFTIVRRTGLDIINKAIRTKPRDDMSAYESSIGYEASSDVPALDGFEHGMVADAFKSLPERWQAVLWYTEVEKKNPKEIAPLLGLSANGVAALAYRAREALRQAYLQQHLNTSQSAECLAANSQLGAYVRGGLSTREHAKVEAHVQACDSCAALVAELADVNRGMRGIIAPLFMGSLGVGALEGGLPIGGVFGIQGAGAGGAAGAGGTGGATTGGTASMTGVASTGTGAATGIAGVMGVAAHVALPIVAVIGVTTLALTGASVLGWFGPDTGGADGAMADGPAVTAPSDEPAPPAIGPGPEGSVEDPAPAPAPGATGNSADAAVEGDTTVGGGGGVLGAPAAGSPASTAGTASTTGPGATGDEGSDVAGPDDSDPGDAGPDAGGPDDSGPTPGPTPDPLPPPPPPAQPVTSAQLNIGKSALDYLEISPTSPQVSMTIANTGDAVADEVVAHISLPEGLALAPLTGGGAGMALVSADRIQAHLEYAADGVFSTDGWQCAVGHDRSGATCTRDHIEAGTVATLTLNLSIVADALSDDAVTAFTVTSGDVRASYKVHTALASTAADSNPLQPGYANTGGEAVAHFGSTVMGCAPAPQPWTACYTAMMHDSTEAGAQLSNNDWNMVQLNQHGGVHNSGLTAIDLPEKATVKAAYLEWSANRYVHPSDPLLEDAWTTSPHTAQVRLGSGEFVTVVADTVNADTVEEDRQYYLARADVTTMLADVTSTTMTIADIAVAQTRREQAVHTYYGGFTVTIVYADPAVAQETRVALYQGPHWVRSSSPVTINFHAKQGAHATASWTAYEGDRGNSGDRLSIDGDSLTPLVRLTDGTTQLRNSADAADSWANGSTWTNTLGIDANSFASKVLNRTGRHSVTASSDGDNFMIGTIAVAITPPGTAN